MKEGILLALTFLMVLLTFLPLWKNPHWSIRGLDFPRLQLCVLAFALLLAQALLLSYSEPLQMFISGVAIVCLAYQAWWIIPYTWLWPKEVKSAGTNDDKPRIKVMAANVLTPNRQADRLKALVREFEPDILVTLETDSWWEEQLEELTDAYPHSIRCPLDNLYGMHVYSRLPLENAETRFLVEDDVPSMHAKVWLTSQIAIRMHFLHPAPPSPTENDESTERDVELLVVAKSVRDDKDDIPIIVTGDLNDVAWSFNTRLFRKISGLLDPRVGRCMVNSFHAQHWFLRWPLDHLFHSHHFRLVKIQRLHELGLTTFRFWSNCNTTPRLNSKACKATPKTNRRPTRRSPRSRLTSPMYLNRKKPEPFSARRSRSRTPSRPPPADWSTKEDPRSVESGGCCFRLCRRV